MKVSNEVYPNSPLVEVVFEIRFPGEMAVECRRHEFWDRIRLEYPKIWVPKVDPARPLAFQPYRFEREDGSAGVMVALNRFGYFARKYPGHRAFQAEFLRLGEVFGELFSLQSLTRIGWRYINIIPFVRENGLIPLEQFLKLGFRVPSHVPERFHALGLIFVSQLEGAKVTTRLDALRRSDDDQEALLLDFDYAKEHPLRFADVEEHMKQAHTYTRQLFEDLITEDYRRYLRGEVLS